MRFVDVITHKRDGLNLSKEEINFWIEGIVDDSIPDYQSSALLMAIAINGMTFEETTYLTEAMVHSGEMIDLSDIEGIIVDKHSTGGVGDKTSMIIGPIVAACNAKVAKMSGRGLGHTGGTLDKLESIRGYDINLDNKEFIKQVNDINIAVVGQTGNLVYADKVLYALRDVTATVSSIPLIAASIMSKKLAGGADAIVLDVKYGDGAFMKDANTAKELAETMIHIGKNLGRNVTAMITSMDQPLGNTIGNALEVYESVQILRNEGPEDLREICLEASAHMLVYAEVKDNYQDAYNLAQDALTSGKAYDTFVKWIETQKGDVAFLDGIESFKDAKHKINVYAEEDAYIESIKTTEMGIVSVRLGAGRNKKEDEIDYKAGITLFKKVSDKVNKGDLLATLQCSNEIADEIVKEFKACYKFTNKEVAKPVLIEEVL